MLPGMYWIAPVDPFGIQFKRSYQLYTSQVDHDKNNHFGYGTCDHDAFYTPFTPLVSQIYTFLLRSVYRILKKGAQVTVKY